MATKPLILPSGISTKSLIYLTSLVVACCPTQNQVQLPVMVLDTSWGPLESNMQANAVLAALGNEPIKSPLLFTDALAY